MLPRRADDERGQQLPARSRSEAVEYDPAPVRGVPRLRVKPATRHSQAVRPGPVSAHDPQVRLEAWRTRVLTGGVEREAPTVRRVRRHLVYSLAGADHLEVPSVAPHGHDLLASIALEEVERDAASIGAPVREEPRSLAEHPCLTAVGASAKERTAGPRTWMVIAEQDRPIRPGKRRTRRAHEPDSENG